MNTLDYVTVVIPVTFSDKHVDHQDPEYVPVGDLDKENWEACQYPVSPLFHLKIRVPFALCCAESSSIRITLLTFAADDADMYHGAPACIQIVGQRFQEEKVLAMAQRIVDALREYKLKQKLAP